MNRFAIAAISSIAFALPLSAGAVINGLSPMADPGVPQNGYPTPVRVTCYAPGAGGRIEGGFETSKSGPNGRAVPCTLDDFRLKRNNCWYVTLAGNQANYNKYYNMGTITYVSVEDGRQYTMTNVVGYVHDTGSAFNSSGCGKYGTCGIMMQKFDVAYGDYRNGGNVGLVNGGSFCGNSSQTWLQVGGEVTVPSTITDGGYVGGNTGGGNYGGYLGGGSNGTGSYGVTSPYYAMQPAGSPYSSASPVPVQSSGGTSGYATQNSAVPVSQQLNGSTISSPFSSLTSNTSATNLQNALNPTPTQSQTTPPSQSVIPGAPSVASIYVQPRVASRTGSILISWTSLNMKPGTCTVKQDAQQIAVAQEGSKTIAGSSVSTGTTTFTLSCTAQDGSAVAKTDTITVQ